MSALGITIGDGWRIGPVIATCARQGEIVERELAGWVSGRFGLHYSMFADDDGEPAIPGFVLTHLPTGYVVRHLHCGLSDAQRVASALQAAADWDFDDPASAKRYEAAVAVGRAMEQEPDIVFSGSRSAFGPLP